jgi:hypothetical protein
LIINLAEQQVEKFAKYWSEMTSTTTDIAQETHLISGLASEVIESAGPISNLIAFGLGPTLKVIFYIKN